MEQNVDRTQGAGFQISVKQEKLQEVSLSPNKSLKVMGESWGGHHHHRALGSEGSSALAFSSREFTVSSTESYLLFLPLQYTVLGKLGSHVPKDRVETYLS